MGALATPKRSNDNILTVFFATVPQIVLNVQRGAARLTLRRDYVIGTTIARLVLPTYFWGYKDNVLAIETSRTCHGLSSM